MSGIQGILAQWGEETILNGVERLEYMANRQRDYMRGCEILQKKTTDWKEGHMVMTISPIPRNKYLLDAVYRDYTSVKDMPSYVIADNFYHLPEIVSQILVKENMWDRTVAKIRGKRRRRVRPSEFGLECFNNFLTHLKDVESSWDKREEAIISYASGHVNPFVPKVVPYQHNKFEN